MPISSRSPATHLKIKCPACGTRMVQTVHEGITLDHCPFCEGIWFDAAEFDRLVTTFGGTRIEAALPDRGISALSCPRCRPHMLHAAGWSGLVVDRCRKCRGLYLDAPEFKALVRDGPPRLPVEHAVLDTALGAADLLTAKGLIAFLMRYFRL